MATPKTLAQKIAQYQNDSFNVWLQKTNINAIECGNLNLLDSVLLSELQSLSAKVGTISGTINEFSITGLGTSFNTDLQPGTTIKITPTVGASFERQVISIQSNTSITVDVAIPATFSGATYENLQELSLVSSINYVYQSEIRKVLIKAIAMS